MKIIFLDFDGVMNCNSTKDRLPHPFMPGRRVMGLDADLVRRVWSVAASAGAKVVISSTWREFYTLDGLRLLLKSYGWEDDVQIIDQTPVDAEPGQGLIQTLYARGDEIQAWLTKNGTPDRFLVLDDLPTQFLKTGNQIQTDENEGFSAHLTERAMQILGIAGATS